MGLYDRDYTQADSARRYFGPSQLRFNLPRLMPVVRWLLVANIAVFILELLVPSLYPFFLKWFAADARSWRTGIQLWRLVSYQFLHGGTLHLLLNMVGLFFCGPSLEKHWGSRRFLSFYLGCGVVGGLLYLLLAAAGLVDAMPLLGASGAILGILAACAILFPHFVVLLFYVIPIPIRVGAVIFILLSVLNIARNINVGGEVAHLGGMAAGAGYVLLLPRWERVKLRMRAQSWEKRLEEGRKLRVEVDRLLAKVHRSGLHSLTAREKRTLKRATQEEVRRHQLL
ncbi:MAG: hypothetical protein A2Y77_16595 [Planctomycetes bacterium RBG_13_62_9]|nr:MAG: hypothetical protein A2Y77_16595 [Planctomycetes bacterium RBG_13_62_9]